MGSALFLCSCMWLGMCMWRKGYLVNKLSKIASNLLALEGTFQSSVQKHTDWHSTQEQLIAVLLRVKEMPLMNAENAVFISNLGIITKLKVEWVTLVAVYRVLHQWSCKHSVHTGIKSKAFYLCTSFAAASVLAVCDFLKKNQSFFTVRCSTEAVRRRRFVWVVEAETATVNL